MARNLFNYPNFYPTPLFNQNVNNWDGAGHQGLNNDQGDVKIPDQDMMQKSREILDELRRRAGEHYRPQIELDYIDRLLQRF